MLMSNFIKNNVYFKSLNIDENYILDSLTSTLERKYILEYVNYLIQNQKHFYLAILDIDNFKSINDAYGHHSGDIILKTISNNIMHYSPDNTLVGRFGGDEFLLILEGIDDYNTCWRYLREIFENGIRITTSTPVAENIQITATAGTASYPNDANTYEKLFEICDKCLYHGKNKGRNRFIIYRKEIHEKLPTTRLSSKTLSEKIIDLYSILDSSKSSARIDNAMNWLAKQMALNGIICHFNENKIVEYNKNSNKTIKGIPYEHIKKLYLRDKIYIKANNINFLEKRYTEFYNFCLENKINSFLLYEVKQLNSNDDIYFLIYDTRLTRIWQNDEESLFIVFARAITSYISL